MKYLLSIFITIILAGCNNDKTVTQVSNSSISQVIAKNDIKTCEDIDKNLIKELIFKQIAKDGESIGALCALEKTINKECQPADKQIYTQKWDEFVNLSKLKQYAVLEEQYSDPKICSYEMSLSFAVSPTYFSNNIRIDPRIFVNKKENKSILTMDSTFWLGITIPRSNDTSIIEETIGNFRHSLLLAGFFREENDKLSPNKVNHPRKNLQVTLGKYDEPMYDKNYDIKFRDYHYEYLEKTYFNPSGTYIQDNIRISVNGDMHKGIDIISTSCPDKKIHLNRTDVFGYTNTTDDPKVLFNFFESSNLIVESENTCIPSGKLLNVNR